jgi:DNA-binding protein Fis
MTTHEGIWIYFWANRGAKVMVASKSSYRHLVRPLFYAIVQLSEGTQTQESKYLKTSRKILRWHEKKLKN